MVVQYGTVQSYLSSFFGPRLPQLYREYGNIPYLNNGNAANFSDFSKINVYLLYSYISNYQIKSTARHWSSK